MIEPLHFDFPLGLDLDDVFDVAMIRERPSFQTIRVVRDFRRRIHLGPGNKHIEGWTELDYPEWDAETMGLPYNNESVDAFLALHVLDHLSATAVQDLMSEVQRCLVPGGTFTIVVPHHLGTLAWECIEHKTRYGLKTWRNIFANPAYTPINISNRPEIVWRLDIGFNMIMGVEERNLVLVTQLIRRSD